MINTLLVDLDDVMFNTKVVKKDLMSKLRAEYRELHPDFESQRVLRLVRRAYDYLKVEGNCEAAKNVKNLPADLRERAIVELAGPYDKFMAETLFDSSNKDKYFTPSNSLLYFLNYYFQGPLYSRVYDSLIRDNLENERVLAEEKFNYIRFLRRIGDTDLIHENYSCPKRVFGIVTNGYPETQRRKIEMLGIGNFFDFVQVSGDSDVNCRKPEMDFYRVAMEKARKIGKQKGFKVSQATTVIIDDRAKCFPKVKNEFHLIKIGGCKEQLNENQQDCYNVSCIEDVVKVIKAIDVCEETEARMESNRQAIALCEKDIGKPSVYDDAYMYDAGIMDGSFPGSTPHPCSYSQARQLDKQRYQRYAVKIKERKDGLISFLEKVKFREGKNPISSDEFLKAARAALI